MLLHDFLRRKAAIVNKAKAELDNLLTEISDPKTKAIVEDWEPGDPITDEYPQGDQKTDEQKLAAVPGAVDHSILSGSIPGAPKKEEATEQHMGEVIHTNVADIKAAAEGLAGKEPEGDANIDHTQADAGAETNHRPEGQPQQEPASGNPPA